MLQWMDRRYLNEKPQAPLFEAVVRGWLATRCGAAGIS
jgi:hypothetical protein